MKKAKGKKGTKTRKASKNGGTPIERQRFRYWVELRDLRDGTVRELPVQVVQCLVLPTSTKEAKKLPPDEIRIRVQDGNRVFDASDVQDLSRQLREHYPDGAFEGVLKGVRDLEAEERRRSAMEELAQIFARAAVNRALSQVAEDS